jgi:hypothetical protein
LVVKNCPQLFTKDEFRVESASIELLGFNWYLAAKVKEKGYLAVYLHAVPPNGYNGNYQIEVNWLAIQTIQTHYFSLKKSNKKFLYKIFTS